MSTKQNFILSLEEIQRRAQRDHKYYELLYEENTSLDKRFDLKIGSDDTIRDSLIDCKTDFPLEQIHGLGSTWKTSQAPGAILLREAICYFKERGLREESFLEWIGVFCLAVDQKIEKRF